MANCHLRANISFLCNRLNLSSATLSPPRPTTSLCIPVAIDLNLPIPLHRPLLLLLPLLLAGTAYANHLTTHYNPLATYAALGIHIFSWIIQFIGHGVFEGRAPALLDNLVQAVFLAPFFVWLEFLFMCGYRPELRQRLKTRGSGESMAGTAWGCEAEGWDALLAPACCGMEVGTEGRSAIWHPRQKLG